MKKLFENFKWSMFAGNTIGFIFFRVVMAFLDDKFKSPDFRLSKYLFQLLISCIVAGFIMSFVMSLKIFQNLKKKSDVKN